MASLRYTTNTDFYQQIPRDMLGLLTNDGDTLQPDADIVTAALLDAEQTVESYLAQRYDLPLTDDGTNSGVVPQKIITTVHVLAKYTLYGRRDAITNEVQVQYDATMRWLRDVVAGKASVVLLDANDEITDEGDAVIEVSTETESQFDKFV